MNNPSKDQQTRLERIVARIAYTRADLTIRCEPAGFRIVARRPDTFTGEMAEGSGGLREVVPSMSDSQIVRAVFAALLSYESHEAAEAFLFDGKRIFGPHIDVSALASIAHLVAEGPSA